MSLQESIIQTAVRPKSTGKTRLLELDALRGIAVLLVVCFHLTMGPQQADIFKIGVTGVDLFFVISGFVILLTLEKVDRWQDFVMSRFSRLYPTYWFCVSFTAGLIIIKNVMNAGAVEGLSIPKYLVNLTMFQLYFNVPDLDGAYWTMIVEMIFYIFMLAVFVAKKLPSIERIGFLGLIPVFLYHLTLNTQYHIVHQALGRYLPLINHFPMFLAGILVYKIKFDRPTFIRYFGIVGCFLFQYHLFFDGGKSRLFITQPLYAVMLFIYLIIAFLYVNNALSFVVNPVTLFMGKISYSLYLTHQILVSDIVVPFMTQKMQLNFWVAAFAVALPIAIGVATLINQYVERPAMKYLRARHKTAS